MGVKRRAGLGFGALALALAGRAGAHPEISALGTNRYVTAAILDGRVDVADVLLEGTLASGDERKRLDADGDGRISEAERAAGERRLAAEGPALTVEVDGRAVTAPFSVSINLGAEPAAGAAPVVIERRATFERAWPAGARTLRLLLTRDPPRPLDAEVYLALAPGYTLARGAELVTFRGPRTSALEERAATFEIVGPPAKGGKAVVLLGILALLLAGVVARARLRKR